MKNIALIIRIISYITTAPALIFFFYFMLKAVASRTASTIAVNIVLSLLSLVVPVILNLFSRHLDGTLYER